MNFKCPQQSLKSNKLWIGVCSFPHIFTDVEDYTIYPVRFQSKMSSFTNKLWDRH